MDLSADLSSFLGWLKDHALKGFRAYTDDKYFGDDYKTVTEELEYLADQMKASVRRGDSEHYFLCRNAYLKIYSDVNRHLSLATFNSLVDKLMCDGYEDIDAQRGALDFIWQDRILTHWLPVSAKFTGPQGQEVFLAANKRHIPQDKDYVLLTELESLKNSERSPWEYAQQRTAL